MCSVETWLEQQASLVMWTKDLALFLMESRLDCLDSKEARSFSLGSCLSCFSCWHWHCIGVAVGVRQLLFC